MNEIIEEKVEFDVDRFINMTNVISRAEDNDLILK